VGEGWDDILRDKVRKRTSFAWGLARWKDVGSPEFLEMERRISIIDGSEREMSEMSEMMGDVEIECAWRLVVKISPMFNLQKHLFCSRQFDDFLPH
jgi:hypothetical protein